MRQMLPHLILTVAPLVQALLWKSKTFPNLRIPASQRYPTSKVLQEYLWEGRDPPIQEQDQYGNMHRTRVACPEIPWTKALMRLLSHFPPHGRRMIKAQQECFADVPGVTFGPMRTYMIWSQYKGPDRRVQSLRIQSLCMVQGCTGLKLRGKRLVPRHRHCLKQLRQNRCLIKPRLRRLQRVQALRNQLCVHRLKLRLQNSPEFQMTTKVALRLRC